MPNRYEVFSREYYWSSASIFFQIDLFHGGGGLPTKLEDSKMGEKIATAHKTAIYFLWEEEFDCSKEEAIAYHKPSLLLLLSLDLELGSQEGQYVNEKMKLFALTLPFLKKDQVVF